MTAPRRPARAARGAAELELFEAPAATPPPPRVVAEAMPGESPAAAVSVSALTHTARDVLEGAFMPLWVRGEVSDFKAHRNGHWYFRLRDAQSQLRAVVWSRERRRIPAPPDDGMQVVAFGQLTVYATRGEMQFAVSRLEAEGDGLWRKALDLTRARLQADGLLDPARKRPLPRFPRRVALITSSDGAALRDVVAVVRRRSPHVELVLIPAVVQGESAPESLCFALDQVTRWGDADVLIIGRGGGGREDLWAFNDERVARALAVCPIPTISAVGHEIDVSICDLVADVRAATPSAAAEAAVPVADELRGRLASLAAQIGRLAARRVDDARGRAVSASRSVVDAGSRTVERRRARIDGAARRLDALSPLAVLRRGFAVVRSTTGATIRSAHVLAPGDAADVVLRDGVVRVTTERVSHQNVLPAAAHTADGSS